MLASQNQSIILNSLKGALILDASVCLLIDAMILKPDSSARWSPLCFCTSYSSAPFQPERINPDLNQKGYSVKSDIWSLGITMVSQAAQYFFFFSTAALTASTDLLLQPSMKVTNGH